MRSFGNVLASLVGLLATTSIAGACVVTTTSPISWTFNYQGGNFDLLFYNQSFPESCSYGANTSAGWITDLTGPYMFNGSVSTAFSVTVNPATTPRTGTITALNLTFTVNQLGNPNGLQPPAGCTMNCTPGDGPVTTGPVQISDPTLNLGKVRIGTATQVVSVPGGSSSSSGLGVGDLNGDGRADLIVAGAFVNSVFVLLGNGDGTFRSPVEYPVGIHPNGKIEASDFNADGRLDLAVACQSSGSVSILMNRGDGTFQSATTYTGFATAFSVTAADLNNDGKVDLAVGANTTSPVLLGNGDGTFVRGPVSASFSNGGIAAGDLNVDGKADLVGRGSFFSGLGNGMFSQGIPYGGDALWPSVGDFNGDGKLDIVARLRSGDPNAPGGVIALGNGNGTFQPAVTFDAGGTFGWAATAADLRRIGVFDAILTADITPPLSVVLGQPGGTLTRRINYGAFFSGSGSPAVAGDFNGDGIVDIAASQGGSIGIIFGRGDGTFSAPQMLVLSNSSSTMASISVQAITGPNANEFSITYNNCSNAIGNSGARQCYIGVSFSPVSVGSKSAVLTLSDTAGGQHQVILTGEGIPLKANTATAVSVSPNAPSFGSLVTITATVSPSAATGSVRFVDGTETMGTATLIAGTATITTASLAVGSHSITAVYNGDNGYNGSTSGATTVAVSKANSNIVVSSNANPAVSGGVLFSATVLPSGVTGSVQFVNGGIPFASGPLSNGGNIIFTGQQLLPGTYPITAVYSGDANYNGSTSAAYTQVVAAPTTPTNTIATFTEGTTTVTAAFSSISTSGNTTVTPIDPVAAGSIPGGFLLAGSAFAFDVSTTAGFNGPITTCFVVPSVDPVVFPFLRILHNENGILIDRTILSGTNAPNLSTRTVCASTVSLSPFVLAQVTDLAAPTVTNVTLTPNPVPAGAALTLTASVTDAATGNSRIASAEYSVDGGTTWQPVTASYYVAAAFDVTTTVPGFAAATVQNVCVRATDAARNTGKSCTLLAVYDPNAGFVTGGGWITSPAGAYVPNPTLTARANFGFVAKYQRGATTPSGQTQFEFQTGSLTFQSTSYEWLVVSGARAQFKGSGTINGAGSYGFILTAIDGQVNGGGGVDKVRIKIVDKQSGAIVYDNQMGTSETSDNATALSGGSILIHE